MLGEGSGSQRVGQRESKEREVGIGDPPVHPSKLLALSFILFHDYTIIIRPFKGIFASQGLRFALLNFTFGIVRRIFVIPAHCHLLDFDIYATCNDVIFSQSTRGFHILLFECPEN